MIKMNDSNDNKSPPLQSKNKISYIIPLGFQKKKDNSFPQKAKEYLKSKKSVSMGQIIENNKNISININQNININSIVKELGLNLENKEKGSKSKTENHKTKGNKMKTSIFGSEKMPKNNLVLSAQFNKNKTNDDSSGRIDNLLNRNIKIEKLIQVVKGRSIL